MKKNSLPRIMAGLLIVLGCLSISTCTWLGGISNLPSSPSPDGYTYRSPSSDGIGKIYQGREIAQVMGHEGAYWLERPSRELEERPLAAIEALGLAPTAIVADIGAGTGYFATRIARRVPQGKVLAVDIQPEMLALLGENLAEAGITNVEGILGQPDRPNLPPEGVDLALLVDAYHEFEYPREMMMGIRSALKPGGRVVLVEYRAENPLILIKRLHKLSAAQARRELAAVGLRWIKTDDRLPQQHLLFFEKPIS